MTGQKLGKLRLDCEFNITKTTSFTIFFKKCVNNKSFSVLTM